MFKSTVGAGILFALLMLIAYITGFMIGQSKIDEKLVKLDSAIQAKDRIIVEKNEVIKKLSEKPSYFVQNTMKIPKKSKSK